MQQSIAEVFKKLHREHPDEVNKILVKHLLSRV
jgi:hypothetical protein